MCGEYFWCVVYHMCGLCGLWSIMCGIWCMRCVCVCVFVQCVFMVCVVCGVYSLHVCDAYVQ